MEFMDMNDDCLEHVLKTCGLESLVALSRTCKRLNVIAIRLFKFKTSYHPTITSREDSIRVKYTIGSIGKHVTELDIKGFVRGLSSWLNGEFFDGLSQKCPNLQILKIKSSVSTNIILNRVHKLQSLEQLSIHSCLLYDEHINKSLVISLVHELKNLQSFEVRGSKWKVKVLRDFLLSVPENLKSFSCEIYGIPKLFEVGEDFLRKLKSSDSPMEILQQFIIDGIEYYPYHVPLEEFLGEFDDDYMSCCHKNGYYF